MTFDIRKNAPRMTLPERPALEEYHEPRVRLRERNSDDFVDAYLDRIEADERDRMTRDQAETIVKAFAPEQQ